MKSAKNWETSYIAMNNLSVEKFNDQMQVNCFFTLIIQ